MQRFNPPVVALSTMTVAGVVLAGGRSRRFGRDKALELLGGRPLAAWSLEALRPVSSLLALNGPPGVAERLGLPAVADCHEASAGPLAGVLGALAWAAAQGCTHLLTAPCDTPFLPPDFGTALAVAIGPSPVAAARADRPHPLCALWRTDLSPALASIAAGADQPPLHRVISELGGVYVEFPDPSRFTNLNTAAEFAAAVAWVQNPVSSVGAG
jgi:molybdopterin-guanine dinucleotide biosynthesis protein A